MYGLVKVLLLPPALQLATIALGLSLIKGRRWLGMVLAVTGLMMIWALATPWLATRLITNLETSPPLTEQQAMATGAQAIVILSADRVQDAPQFGGFTLGPLALQRLHYGARLQRLTHLPILITGGIDGVNKPPVAEVMAEALAEDFRLPTAYREDLAQDTFENARLSASILKDNGITRILLVTHAFHMPRARHAFESFGLTVIPAPTAFNKVQDMSVFALLPSAQGLMQSYLALHEYLGEAWYRFHYGPWPTLRHLLPDWSSATP